jgi:hypothetical protein
MKKSIARMVVTVSLLLTLGSVAGPVTDAGASINMTRCPAPCR